MKLAFCTLFDRQYLARGLTMARSLRRCSTSSSHPLFALCLDDVSYGCLEALAEPGLQPIRLDQLLAHDPELAAASANRSHAEFCFTLSPCLPLHLLRTGNFDATVSVDADLFFLSDPAALARSLQNLPLFITRHAFTPAIRHAGLKTGEFNVSFQGFRNDPIGLACLTRWRRQCLDWCGAWVDEQNHRFADQRYLDTWPTDFPGDVGILDPPLAGLAPWNLRDHTITKTDGHLLANGVRPCFYHFHGLHFLGRRRIANSLWKYHASANPTVTRHLYAPYLRELIETEAACARATGTHAAVHPDTAWNRWRAQSYFESEGTSFRSVDRSHLHPLQQAWRLLKSTLSQES